MDELHDLNVKIESLEAELAARKDDSMVLMQVVEIVNDDTITERKAVRQIAYVLVDYLNIPRCANKASTIIDANIMIEELNDRIISGASDISALRFANIDLEREVAKQKETIDELKSPNARYAQTISDRFDTIKALRIDVADRDRHIEELEATIARLNMKPFPSHKLTWFVCRMCNRVRAYTASDLLEIPGRIPTCTSCDDGMERSMQRIEFRHETEEP